jgi:hypothetical protein
LRGSLREHERDPVAAEAGALAVEGDEGVVDAGAGEARGQAGDRDEAGAGFALRVEDAEAAGEQRGVGGGDAEEQVGVGVEGQGAAAQWQAGAYAAEAAEEEVGRVRVRGSRVELEVLRVVAAE